MEPLPTKRSKGDYARDTARAAISMVPMAGGPLQVAFEALFSAPIEKRKERWLQQLSEVVVELGARVDELTPERLVQDDVFVTVVMQASQIALRNHQSEKLEALRNAVLNAVLSTIEEDEKFIFLRLIDQLAPVHLRLLKFLDDPGKWMDVHGIGNPGWSMGGVSTVIEHCFPAMAGRREVYDQVIRDLQTEGLVSQGSFAHVTMSGSGMLESRSSPRGRAFLQFITDTALSRQP
ncbi:hypothetical protein E7V67_002000 [[Empedobacter] haloabium]|uniref:DUF4393 domain-containing protein n=1 Tax=[Empedobacter] haloabium TaxID=592317 RepID=A0ABZ1UP73_9BURK